MTGESAQRCVAHVAGAALIAVVATGCSAYADTGSDAAPRTASATPSRIFSPSALPSTAPPSSTPLQGIAAGGAMAVLDQLPVKGPAAMTGYVRDDFHWKADVDRNGCDTRNDILRRDLTGTRFKAGSRGCAVESGTLVDPYSGRTIQMVRAPGDPVDIDHVVALGNAWVTGAFSWSPETKTALANDPLNLLAVDGSLNRQKGDSDSASWLPPNRSYRCAYVVRQVAVKQKYGLWLKPAEKDRDARVLRLCPSQPLPTEASVSPPRIDPDAPAAPPRSTPSAGAQGAPGPTYYANCDAVRAAGKSPLRRGQPGYETPRLDRDGDGVACE